MRTVNILFYGIGGQGVLTAAEICALAAMFDGYHVKKSEVKGMSQRGGSVESFVRFGDAVLSPLPFSGEADAIICLHKSEYSRMKDELKPGGADLSHYLEKGHAAVGGKAMFLNTYMLGVLSSFLGIKEESWLNAIKSKLKKDTEENKRIFLMGRSEAKR
jgi:indolepyruvate ferredoxin oxidoreductase beta subunit